MMSLMMDGQVLPAQSLAETAVQPAAYAVLSFGSIILADVLLIAILCGCAFFQGKHDRARRKDLWMAAAFTGAHLLFILAFGLLKQDSLNAENLLLQHLFQVLLFIMIFVQYLNTVKMRALLRSVQELETLQNCMEKERDYYQLAEHKLTEISELRHDLQDQLRIVRQLLSKPDCRTQAENMITMIQNRLDSVRVVNYCENRTINAVLTAKLEEERMRGIRTEIVLRDCGTLPFEDYDLCSLVSNLFDNAVSGCLRAKDASENFIDLKSGIVGEYFVIRCINPCSSEEQLNAPSRGKGHGYGKSIMMRICKKYDGDFSLRYENGTAIANAALHLQNF